MAQRVIALNASSGAFVSVAVSGFFNRCVVQEDGAAAAQGLQVKFPQDRFVQVYTFQAGQGFEIDANPSGAIGEPVQNPDNNTALPNYRAADVMFEARSASGTATSIQVIEQQIPSV